ncbi:MAG TPA: ornithine carbamoyltransferase [Candidatus Sumerlaeota bacterium]|nr:ornithine carbamoyltransferase [Candidatus Sumerlaeota bacterium]HON49337.1 ornithine carbamoyltransferase [Candidatus Sumerlaeota bacterium]HOR64915.1 ornithine carbamoyltransferase [Candidatus Sumerlaeota bacterium]HPL73068.1 ornithine carbamoyltransferase [Candidatus Sumerlaeota bacterium]HRU52896.1 ornithine carbamoyltransferase [Candidatus Sumerlaeia bacterium]
MSKRDMISICDVNKEEALEIFETAKRLKAGVKKGDFPPLLEKRCLAMIFEKPSLRTRCSFEVGMFQLGGHAVYLQPSDIGLGKRESVYDVAKNIERWFNIALARVFKNQTVAELARHASIPVINALCDVEHPCQAFADFMTILEHRGKFEGFRLAYIGDGNNVCHSLILLSALLGTHINVSSPAGFEPQKSIIEKAANMCKESGGSYNFFRNPADAVKNAEAIYTDVWASMGQESEAENRKKIFLPYQVNKALVSNAPSGVWIMHDMPAHRGEEITDEVIDSKNSIVFDQAENRLHAQKGIIVFLSR